ncbi:MAG: hypothetical protein ACK492_02805 [Chitinophagaceae bacterium]
MNLSFQDLIPADFSPESRVWIYQANRLLTLSEALELEKILDSFISDWKAHGQPVKGFANLFFGQFIVLIADEKNTSVSGCSTDSSVRMIKAIEDVLKISLFDRNQLAFVIKDKIQLLPLAQVEYALKNQFIQSDTLFFDHSVSTKTELLEKWIVPLSSTWLGRRYLVNI